jgi:hypothetical protein
VRTGSWWRRNATPEVNVSEGLKITGAGGSELLLLPDCYGEIFTVEKGDLVMTGQELTFIAVGRTHSDHRIVRGLLLVRSEAAGKNLYRRIGMFQVPERGSFAVAEWDVMPLTVV